MGSKLDKTPHLLSNIQSLDPVHYREMDGVVLDLDSYERHCKQIDTPVTADPPPAHGVFLADPQHNGWYPATENTSRYPVMGGAVIRPLPTTDTTCSGLMVYTANSGSFISWYASSYSSWFGSSFFYSGSFYGSNCLGGYGLELI